MTNKSFFVNRIEEYQALFLLKRALFIETA